MASLAIYKTRCDVCASKFNTTTALLRHRVETSHYRTRGRVRYIRQVLQWTRDRLASPKNKNGKVYELQAMDKWDCRKYQFLPTSESRWYVIFLFFVLHTLE